MASEAPACDIPTFQGLRILFHGSCCFTAQLRNPRFNARDVATQRAQAARLFELRAGLLQPQIKYFLPQIPAVRQQLGRGLFLNLLSLGLFHDGISPFGAGK